MLVTLGTIAYKYFSVTQLHSLTQYFIVLMPARSTTPLYSIIYCYCHGDITCCKTKHLGYKSAWQPLLVSAAFEFDTTSLASFPGPTRLGRVGPGNVEFFAHLIELGA